MNYRALVIVFVVGAVLAGCTRYTDKTSPCVPKRGESETARALTSPAPLAATGREYAPEASQGISGADLNTCLWESL